MTDYDAFPQQRQALLQQMLQDSGRVVGADVARQLGVSEHTIRRDLQELARRGLCQKVYGGAVSQLKGSASFETRMTLSVSEKNEVARKCASLVRAGTSVFIDCGSTYLAMAGMIPEETEVTVVTNSPQIAAALSGRRSGELILLGGRINPMTGSTLSSDTVSQVRGMVFDQAFIGVCGLDAQAGLSAVYYEDACFKKEVIARSSEVVAAVIADKVSRVARYTVAACDELDIIVASAQTDVTGFANVSITLL